MRFQKGTIKDSELIPDILAERPEQISYLNCTVIVDGCPVVGKAKSELLKNVLLKKFKAYGEITYSNMPVTAKEMTKGFMFIVYQVPESATKAVHEMNKFALDKTHTLLVSLLSDFENAVNVKEEWVAPEKKPFNDTGNLKSWLLNEFCRNQFAVLEENGEECSIHWLTTSESISIEKRRDWTDGWVHWSPQGTYLATMHLQGIALWGGEKFVRIARYAHKDVRMLDFSPSEKFMVTFSPQPQDEENPQARPLADMVIWDVRKGTICRNFSGTVDMWPSFKWSYDDQYVATLQGGKIYVYDTETFKILDKKSISANADIADFAWSPTENVIAYWVPEATNTPARVAILAIPSRKELCTKNLFSVAEINLVWHPQGDFLATQVVRCNKKIVDKDNQVKYMGTFVNFEIVRMREKLYPVDQISVKDTVTCFGWEPTGNRFAYVCTDTSGTVTIPIYEMTKSGKVREITVLNREKIRITNLQWSPKGTIFVVASLRTADASIEFIDANDCLSLAKVEHAMASEIQWDSSGRFLASVVTNFVQKSDNAVWFWNCVGRPLFQMPVNGLRIFSWRPFPPTLLSPEQISALNKSLSNKYSAQFEAEDKMLASKANRELVERRQNQMNEFMSWRANLIVHYDNDKSKRDLLRGVDTDNMEDKNEVEEELEFLVNTSRELYRNSA